MTDTSDDLTTTTPGDPNSRRSRTLGVLACAGAVLLCEALVFRYLFQYGVSNVWRADGAAQHIPGFLFAYRWVTALLSGHGASVGAWSWHLGLGADTLTTLSYYLGDPFALLALLFPVRALEYVFEGLFFLRVLCAGLAGYYYLRTIKSTRFAATAGTLVYVFSGFLLQLGLRHSWFSTPMVLFPLILIGVDRVLARRRWYLLVALLAIAASGDFYFFYQMVIVAVVYAVVRWVEVTGRGERLRRLARDGLRVGGWYALGTLLATFMLLPIGLAVLASSREVSRFGMPLLYDARTYLSYILALAGPLGGNHSFSGGFAIAGLLAAGVVVLRKGKFALKAMLAAFVLFMLFPFFGRMFNGFAFPSYRFSFTAGLFLGASVAVVLSDTRPLSRRELTITGFGLAAFAVLDVAACLFLKHSLLVAAVPLAIGALTWGLFALERVLAQRVRTVRPGGSAFADRYPWVLRAGVLALIVASIAAAAVANYSERFNPRLKSYLASGTVIPMYLNDPGSLVPSLPMNGLQRVDKQRGVLGSDLRVVASHDPLAQGYAGLDFYYSIMAGGLHEYLYGLSDRGMRMAFDYEGFDDRATLETLNAVRYYIAPADGTQFVPYGFVRSSMLGTETVYENRYALPVGYVYHSVVASATYAAMGPLDKQQALLQGVVTDDAQAAALARISPAAETMDVTYTLTPSSGLAWDGATRKISVRQSDAAIDLSFAAVPDSELYVEMTGVRFKTGIRMALTAGTGGPTKSKWFRSPSDNYYFGDQTFLVNLGYFANGTTHARIGFKNKNQYDYTSLHVIAVPMARYPGRVGKLAAEGMRDVKVGPDTLSGTVTSIGDGVLFLSVPYSTGWTATVDGEPAPIFRANVGFSGIAVTGGTHRVELRYATPGLRTGMIVSVLAALLTLGLAVATERRLSRLRRLKAGLAEAPDTSAAGGSRANG